jgi:hypothetical protein
MISNVILLNLLAEIEVFAEVPDDAGPSLHVHPLVAAGVPYCPRAWLGRPLSAAERMAYSRATRRLAIAGQVERVTQLCAPCLDLYLWNAFADGKAHI